MHQTDTIARAITGQIPGAQPEAVTVLITEPLPTGGTNSWQGSPTSLAEAIHTAVAAAEPAASPLQQAEAAKRRRDLPGEIGALMAGAAAMEAAPWYPSRPGDLVHIAYPAAGPFAAYGETYLIEGNGPFLDMRLLHHTAVDPEVQALTGCYASEGADQPLAEAWFEASSAHITVVRDGTVIPNRPGG